MFNFYKKNITILSHFHTLLVMGFDEKKSLSSLQTLCPQQKHTIIQIQTLIKTGMPICEAVQSTLAVPHAFQLHSQALHLTTWLSYMIDNLKQTVSLRQQLINTCGGPLLMLLGASVLNILFILIFIPQTKQLLSQFNISLPIWLQFLDTLHYWISHFGGLFLVVLLGSLFVAVKLLFPKIKQLLAPLFTDYLYKHLLQLFLCLHRNHKTLKEIATSFSCHSQSFLAEPIRLFKSGILDQHCYTTAFRALLPKRIYADILLQSLTTQQLESGLTQLIHLFDISHQTRIKRIANSLKLSVFIFTGLQLALGFYLSMIPMNQLIRRIM